MNNEGNPTENVSVITSRNGKPETFRFWNSFTSPPVRMPQHVGWNNERENMRKYEKEKERGSLRVNGQFKHRLRWVWVCVANYVWCLNYLMKKREKDKKEMKKEQDGNVFFLTHAAKKKDLCSQKLTSACTWSQHVFVMDVWRSLGVHTASPVSPPVRCDAPFIYNLWQLVALAMFTYYS